MAERRAVNSDVPGSSPGAGAGIVRVVRTTIERGIYAKPSY